MSSQEPRSDQNPYPSALESARDDKAKNFGNDKKKEAMIL